MNGQQMVGRAYVERALDMSTVPPPSEHSTAAQLWAEAKQRLLLRAEEKDHAVAQHVGAIEEEKEAWSRLEYAAGRAVPKDPSPAKSSDPRRY